MLFAEKKRIETFILPNNNLLALEPLERFYSM